MSEVLQVLAVVAIVAYVIGRQLKGEPLRGKRVVLLPAILAVIGVVDLTRTAATFSSQMSSLPRSSAAWLVSCWLGADHEPARAGDGQREDGPALMRADAVGD
ncbi:MAG: hypothetical protein ACLPUO_18575 [Streptosporangiaceae bacterium]